MQRHVAAALRMDAVITFESLTSCGATAAMQRHVAESYRTFSQGVQIMEIWNIYVAAVKEFRAKNLDAALTLLDEIKRREPRYRKAYLLESYIWRRRKNLIREFDALSKLVSLLSPVTPETKNLAAQSLSLFATACQLLALPDESVKASVLAAELYSDNVAACYEISNALLAANGSEKFFADDFRALYAEFKKYLTDVKPYPRRFYAHKKIRIGFMSADFFYHPVINWSWALLTKLDKSRFEIHCYSSGAKFDEVTKYLREIVTSWQDISKLTDAQAAELIRNDEIDILFDLSGHTANNRLRVAAYRPASVQISGVGYMNSTGLDAMDYFLSDKICAGDLNYFTEKVICLPSSHICYETTARIKPAAAPPCLKNNFVTFGSFNQYGKVSDSILRAWKKILDAVPNSRLTLKHKIFNGSDGRKFVGERLKRFGFDLARIELRPYNDNHLREYGDVDIALDTFPYTGGVTTCEALYMGVPVVSLYGDRHGTRFGLSILTNVGLKELAVDSFDEYVKRAIGNC
ncbi:MAG: hypothetical protein IJT57_05320, partial [Selenomonadaceae bacterium]|nr:hypothetical protein [Selenomonadaceae bacterium]